MDIVETEIIQVHHIDPGSVKVIKEKRFNVYRQGKLLSDYELDSLDRNYRKASCQVELPKIGVFVPYYVFKIEKDITCYHFETYALHYVQINKKAFALIHDAPQERLIMNYLVKVNNCQCPRALHIL